jgi:hypothetical protein
MHTRHFGLSLIAITVLLGCGGQPAVAIAKGMDAGTTRWNAVLGTPEALRGVVQTRGNASLVAEDEGKRTRIDVSIENAVPRGRHPWVLRTGQCGAPGAELLRVTDGSVLKVDDDGKSRSDATIKRDFPTSGDYMIEILGSTENQTQIVACGNFAAPINR